MAELSNESKIMAKGAFWQIAGLISIKLVSLVYVVLIARLISQDQIGAFYFVLSILGTIAIFGDLGLNTTASRYLPYFYGKNQFSNAKKFIRVLYTVGGALSLIVSILVFVSAEWLGSMFDQPLLAPIIKFMAIYIFVNEIFSISGSVLLGRNLAKENSLAQSAQNLLKLILTIAFFAIYSKNWIILAGPFLLSYILAATYATWIVHVEYTKIKADNKKTMNSIEMLKEITPFGMVVTLVSMFSTLLSYTDKIMMGWLLPAETMLTTVAIYTMAMSIASLTSLFSNAISSIFLPTITHTYAKNEKNFDKIKTITNTAMKWGLITTVPVAVVFVFLSKNILQLIYGNAYISGSIAFAIFSIGYSLVNMTAMQRLTLAGMKMIKIELIMVIIAVIINFILCWVLIPIMDLNGAALAFAISMAVISILGYYYSNKIFSYRLPPDIWKYVLSTFITAFLIYLISPYVSIIIEQNIAKHGTDVVWTIIDKMVKLSILGALYFVTTGIFVLLLHLLKAFGREEMELLKAAMRKTKMPEPWIEQITEKLNWDENG